MNDVSIRKATEADLPAIGRLLEDLTDAMNDTEGMDIGMALRNCRNLLNDAGSHLLVAEIEGALVGFINLTTRKTILHRSPSGLVDELVVAKEYQGKGIGKQLVLAAVGRCKELGCCEVEVSTESTNTKAREFYRKCGFEERGMLLEMDLHST